MSFHIKTTTKILQSTCLTQTENFKEIILLQVVIPVSTDRVVVTNHPQMTQQQSYFLLETNCMWPTTWGSYFI